MMYTICVEFPLFHTHKKTHFYYTSCHVSPLNHLDKSWWLQAPVDWCERHAPSQQKQLKPQKATLQKRGRSPYPPESSHFLGRFVALLIKSPTACKQSLR